MVDIRSKQLVVFDLDGTLAESKLPIDADMSALLVRLLAVRPVAVIGGGSYQKFQDQLLSTLVVPNALKEKLYLFPTCSTRFVRFSEGEWHEVYAEHLGEKEKEEILAAFHDAFSEIGYVHPTTRYGEQLEDRGTQISFSPLGQLAPVAAKQAWYDAHDDTRQALRASLERRLPSFEVRAGGLTTIDVTRQGIDKAYGLRKIESILGIPLSAMVFVGDALYEGGNDYPALQAGVDCVAVARPEDTKHIISAWLADLSA